jgi:F0F1-type ATP synthase delta subunit
MKYKPQDYAKAFTEIALATPPHLQDAVVKNFLRIIKRNGDLAKAKKIVDLAEKILLQKSGRNKWLIEIAREQPQDIYQFFGHLFGKNDIVLKKINPTLVAGIKITKNDEKQFDGSLKKKIDKIFH